MHSDKLFEVTKAGGQRCTPTHALRQALSGYECKGSGNALRHVHSDKLFGVTNAGGQGMHSDTCTPTSSLGLRMQGARGCTPTRALRQALWNYECKGPGDALRHVHSDKLFGITNARGQGMH